MRPNLEALPDRVMPDITPLNPTLPLLGPVGGVAPPALYAPTPTLAVPALPAPNLLPADLVRMQIATPPLVPLPFPVIIVAP